MSSPACKKCSAMLCVSAFWTCPDPKCYFHVPAVLQRPNFDLVTLSDDEVVALLNRLKNGWRGIPRAQMLQALDRAITWRPK